MIHIQNTEYDAVCQDASGVYDGSLTGAISVTFDESLFDLTEQQQALRDTLSVFRQWLWLKDTGHVQFALATIAANLGSGDPVWGVIVGPPSSGKTEPLNALNRLPNVHAVATLTEGALLSGTPKREVEHGSKGGLLRQIDRFGILLVKDFDSVMSMNRDSRGQVLAALREIYDGSWTRHVGTGGGRTLHWEGKCGFLGGATGAIDGAYAVMGALGERFLFYRLEEGDEEDRGTRALAYAGQELEMRTALSDAVHALFATVTIPSGPILLTAQESRRLVALATFVTRCRSAVERNNYKMEITNIVGVEAPSRMVKTLALLLRGFIAIGTPKQRAWDLVTKVALDSMSVIRWRVLQMILRLGVVTTSDVSEETGYPITTTRRVLEELACYHVITHDIGGEGLADGWIATEWMTRLSREIIV